MKEQADFNKDLHDRLDEFLKNITTIAITTISFLMERVVLSSIKNDALDITWDIIDGMNEGMKAGNSALQILLRKISSIFLLNHKLLENNTSFHRSLTLLDGALLVIGSMIGSGIFIVSADIARNVGSAGWLIAVWVITGFITLTAALSYGEFSGMYPKAGGQYVYLREAFGKMYGFLYGWAFLAVIQTGTIAAVGVAFGKFLGYLVPSLGEENVLFGPVSIAGNFQFSIHAAQLVGIFIIETGRSRSCTCCGYHGRPVAGSPRSRWRSSA